MWQSRHLRRFAVSYIRLVMLAKSFRNVTSKLKGRLNGDPMGKHARRVLIGALVFLFFVALYQITAPFLISSSVVRDRMERAVAAWTGHEVAIEGTPDIRFWPKPRVTLRDITISKPINGKPRILGQISRLSAGFDLFEAVLGEPEFTDFRLAGATIFVVQNVNGRLDWADDGRLSRAVRGVKQDGSGQALSSPDDASIGEIRISDSAIEILGPDNHQIRISAIAGAIRWPWLSKGLDINASAVVNGERIAIDGSSTQPLLLLSGRSGNVTGKVDSRLFHGSFNGTVDLTSQGYLSGDASLDVEDLPATLEWSGMQTDGIDQVKSLSLEAKLTTTDTALRFENLAIGVNDVKASGILDLLLSNTRLPRLTGTLAFDRVDLAQLFAAFAQRTNEDTALLQSNRPKLELDLRLSAQQAYFEKFRLTAAAISVMTVGDQARIDIVDSDFESGRLTGRIARTRGGNVGDVALHMTAQDADFGSLFKTLSLRGPQLATRGSLEVSLDLASPLTGSAFKTAKGNIRFKAKSGTLLGVDPTAIRRLSLEKPYFALSNAVSSNALNFDSVDISADVAGGSADIREARIVGTDETLSFSGVIPYASNGLSLSAALKPNASRPDLLPLMVFVGGSWPDPVLWPIAQTTVKPAP